MGGLATATADGQLELAYLPYADLGSGEVLGVEALLRWRHPSAGVLHPSEFFEGPYRALRERDTGQWTIERALTDLAGWPARPGFLLGINASAHQLGDELFIEHLLRTCRRLDVNPCNIIIETSELTFEHPSLAVRHDLDRLRRHGVAIAIDDFGRTIGSLRTLVEVPIDLVKVRAGALAAGWADPNPGLLRVVRQSSRRTAVVGIDTTELLARVRALEVDIGQGYRLSPPLDASTVADRFTTRSTAGVHTDGLSSGAGAA